MKRVLFALLLFVALAPAAHANNKNACDKPIGPLWDIAYCGQYSGGGGTPPSGSYGVGTGGPVAARPCFYYASPTGSDSNNGTSRTSPFLTLTKAQTAMQGQASATQKVVCLMAGTFTISSTLQLTSADNGETWEYDPVSGYQSASISAGTTTTAVNHSGASNVVWNGIKISSFGSFGIEFQGGGSNDLAENMEVTGGTNVTTPADAMSCSNVKTCRLSHNYVHDIASFGIAVYAYNSGQSADGDEVDGNVVIHVCTGLSDCGSIYTDMFGTHTAGGHVKIDNNFVRDCGSASVGRCADVYLDDTSSNVTVTGNIFGPHLAGTLNSGNAFLAVNYEENDDTYNGTPVSDTCCDVFANNIVDIGNSSFETTAAWGGSNFILQHNIVVNSFSGPQQTVNGSCTGASYYASVSGPVSFTFGPNVYVNPVFPGNIFSNGSTCNHGIPNDPTPLAYTAAQLGCSGYLYVLASSSKAFIDPQMGPFTPIVGGWGPPGFIIPTTTNHSCP